MFEGVLWFVVVYFVDIDVCGVIVCGELCERYGCFE